MIFLRTFLVGLFAILTIPIWLPCALIAFLLYIVLGVVYYFGDWIVNEYRIILSYRAEKGKEP